MDAEVYLYGDPHWDGRTIRFAGWCKAIFLNRSECLAIQTVACGLLDTNVLRAAVNADNEIDQADCVKGL
jgi:hypothetical protein